MASASALAPAAPAARAAQVEQRVGDRGDHADARKRVRRVSASSRRDAAQVVQRGADDVHARVRVVDPVDRHLVDAHALALREHEQLGVEEPALVAHGRQQPARRVGADRLEAALGVREARAAATACSSAVVAARDQLALGAAHDARAVRQAGADRHVAVAGDERGDAAAAARAGRWTGRRPCSRRPPRRCAPRPPAAPGRGPSRSSAQQLDAREVLGQRHRATRSVASVLALSAITIRQLTTGAPRER